MFEGTEIGFLKMLSMKVKPVYFLSKEYVVRKGDIGQEVRGSGLINTDLIIVVLMIIHMVTDQARSEDGSTCTGEVLFCVFMDRHEVEVHVDRTGLANKGFIKRTFSCGTNGGNPERARLADLTRSGSQSENRIRFILPACGFGHMISAIVLQVARKGT